MPLNVHAARLRNPNLFQQDSFRTIDITDGIQAIIGRLKGQTSTTTQSFRFNKNKFTPEQAKKWLKDHDKKFILFENAIEESAHLKKRRTLEGELVDGKYVSTIKKKNTKESVSDDINFHGDIEDELPIENIRDKIKESVSLVGSVWEITIIKEGRSANGFDYSEKVLKESIPLFERKGIYGHKYGGSIDHRPDEFTNPNGLALNKVGWVENVRYKSDDTGGRLVGDFHCINSALRDMFSNTWKENKSQMPEFSVDVNGRGFSHGNTRIVTKITNVNSVDIVDEASAGGAFERMVASKSKIFLRRNKMKELLKELLARVKEGTYTIKESIDGKSDEEITGLIEKELNLSEEDIKAKERLGAGDLQKVLGANTLEEMKSLMRSLLDKLRGEEGKISEQKTKEKDMKAKEQKDKEENLKVKESAIAGKVAALETTIKKQRCEVAINTLVDRDPALPGEAKLKIKESLTNMITKEGELSEEIINKQIKKEKEYLSHFVESGEIKGMGMIEVGDNTEDKKQKRLDLMLDPELIHAKESKDDYKGFEAFYGIQDALQSITGVPVNWMLQKQNHRKINDRIKESTTADFPVMLGDSLSKKAIKEYRFRFQRETWNQLVFNDSFSRIEQQKLFNIGGFEEMDTVAEDGTYQPFNTPGRENPTYTPLKKGNTFSVTEEMIINDNLREIREFPLKIARSAIFTLSNIVWGRIFGCVGSDTVNSQLIYDGTTLYTDAHANTTDDALDYDSLDQAATRLVDQEELTSGQAIGLEGKFLIVPHNLKRTAWNITKNELVQGNLQAAGAGAGSATAVGGGIQNAIADYGIVSIPVPSKYLCNTTKAWVLMTSPDDAQGITVGYHNNKREPDILLQNNPTVGDVFTNDRITYKGKFRFGTAITDFRAFQGGDFD